MRARGFRYAAALALACGIAVVGCGGGDSDSSSDSDDETTQTTQTRRGTTHDSGDNSGSNGAAFFANADCRQLSRAFDQGQLSSSLTTGDDPTADHEATAEFLDEASDEAPEEIADDVQVLANAYQDLAERSADIDWAGIRSGNPAAAIGAAQLGQAFADSSFAEAAQNLSAFVAENCTR
jgi:hypothetical protein